MSHFQMKQKENSHFSMGMWSKRLGLSSTSSLTKIISGERGPGDSIIPKFVQYFNFNKSEQDYFSDLVRLSKLNDDIRLKVMLMEKMGREHPDAQLTILDNRSHEVIGHWFCLSLREMTKLFDFNPNPTWINQRLLYPVSEKEIIWALELLLHQGLIKKTNEGQLVPSKGLLQTTNDIASEAIKSYHFQTLKLAQESLHTTPLELREITAETLSIPVAKLPEAKELIRSFKSKFVRLMEEYEGDQIYQLQIQFFPVTKGVIYESKV